ncbi:MAG TPA: Asp-tRNA(Asn)/Glu-tRNA(Gln) amidotransferase subunit GatA [Acidobacteriota bacterium]|nr:Asp-tRNA(Asn)/Glu-tRNA(Gln) amidotransferase subunit GatA [Acidobacteriota bacterium]
MEELTLQPIWRLQELQRSGKAGAEEICRAYLDQIEKLDADLGAYLTLMPEKALETARKADEARAAGNDPGPLAGVPLAIKDNLCLEGEKTTCASRILENYIPPFDATSVARLRAAGAVFLGKTNLDEFAMGSSTEWSAFRIARNPWDADLAPGGSSGGSTIATAAGLAAAALGSDTGGSVRQPASFCGIVGLKPTYGRVSRYGLVAFGSSLDTVCPLTRCVRDAAILLGVMAGHDENDSTSRTEPVPDYLAALNGNLKGLKIGVPREAFGEGLDDQVRAAFENTLKLSEGIGAATASVELPHLAYGIPAYYIVACAEASSNLARFDGIRYGLRTEGFTDLRDQYRKTRTAGFGPEVKRRIMLGTFVLSSGYYDAYYRKGTQVRALIKHDLQKAFEQVDLIAMPTSPTTAFKLGEKLDDPVQMYLADYFTVTANLAGVPAISINCGFSKDGLPIGFQLIAPHLAEDRLLSAAAALEEALGLVDRHPPID